MMFVVIDEKNEVEIEDKTIPNKNNKTRMKKKQENKDVCDIRRRKKKRKK